MCRLLPGDRGWQPTFGFGMTAALAYQDWKEDWKEKMTQWL